MIVYRRRSNAIFAHNVPQNNSMMAFFLILFFFLFTVLHLCYVSTNFGRSDIARKCAHTPSYIHSDRRRHIPLFTCIIYIVFKSVKNWIELNWFQSNNVISCYFCWSSLLLLFLSRFIDFHLTHWLICCFCFCLINTQRESSLRIFGLSKRITAPHTHTQAQK